MGLAVIVALLALAQAPAVGGGAKLYGDTCAACHGADAKGLNGPDLTTLSARGVSDERIFQTIRNGVAGTAMPRSTATDEEIRGIIAHLKTLAPDPRQMVTLVTRDGREIVGERKNEDAFSIQIADTNGRLRGFLKKDLREVRRARSDASAQRPDASAQGHVTYRDLLAGLDDPSRWLSFHGDYSAQRHSPLTQVTPANVGRLAPEWTFQTGTMTRGRGFEATPLLLDGVLYVTGSNDFAWALDARTGRPFWQYRRELPNDLTYGAQAPVNRGFGILGERVFMVTLDAHLGNFMAFDSRTGANLWRYATGTPIWGAAPMTYMLDGRQHVVIASGTTLVSFALSPA